MSSEGLEKLQEIGAQKIHEQTHIPVEHVQAILHGSYDGLNKVQFIGFISILEREYGEDLQTLKLKGIAYFDDLKDGDEGIFIATPDNTKKKLAYVGGAVAVFAIILFVYMQNSNKESVIPQDHNAVIETLKKKVAEKNTTADTTTSDIAKVAPQHDTKSVEQSSKEDKTLSVATTTTTLPDSLKITTKGKVWLGYIELESNRKHQKVVHEIELDPKKNWLFTTGHGYITIYLGDKEYKFRKNHKLKLLYKDGELKEISPEEFKRYNRGSLW